MNADVEATVAQLYQAAAGRVAWERVMQEISVHLRLLLAQVIGVDLRARRVLFSYEGGAGSPEATLDYTRTYHRIDPHAAHAATLPVGEYASFSEALGDSVAARHPFYRDYLIPYGGRYVHGAKLHEQGDRVVILGLHRGLGFDPLRGDEVVVARRLIFHLVRAFDIFMGLRHKFDEAALGHALLHRLSSPTLMLDVQRRIAMRNAAADQLLRRYEALGEDAHGVLRCRPDKADIELGLAMKGLQLSGHPGLETAAPVDRAVLPIPLKGRARPLVLVLMAVRPESSMKAFGAQPFALMTLHDTNEPRPIDRFALAAAFDLTPAEARISAQLASGMNPSDIAQANGTSITTTNTHVRAIHQKLHVTRTSEAIAVLHSFGFVRSEHPPLR